MFSPTCRENIELSPGVITISFSTSRGAHGSEGCPGVAGGVVRLQEPRPEAGSGIPSEKPIHPSWCLVFFSLITNQSKQSRITHPERFPEAMADFHK